jgi:hypothetical protein
VGIRFEEDEEDSMKDIFHEGRPEHENIFNDRVKAWRERFKRMPTHKDWCTWDVYHSQITEMVLLEMDWERLARLVIRDPTCSEYRTDRKKVMTELNGIRSNLCLTGTKMRARMKDRGITHAEVDVADDETAALEESIESMQEYVDHPEFNA